MLKKSSGGRNTLKVTKLMITVKKKKAKSEIFVLLCEQVTKIPLLFLEKKEMLKFFYFKIWLAGKSKKRVT